MLISVVVNSDEEPEAAFEFFGDAIEYCRAAITFQNLNEDEWKFYYKIKEVNFVRTKV